MFFFSAYLLELSQPSVEQAARVVLVLVHGRRRMSLLLVVVVYRVGLSQNGLRISTAVLLLDNCGPRALSRWRPHRRRVGARGASALKFTGPVMKTLTIEYILNSNAMGISKTPAVAESIILDHVRR